MARHTSWLSFDAVIYTYFRWECYGSSCCEDGTTTSDGKFYAIFCPKKTNAISVTVKKKKTVKLGAKC